MENEFENIDRLLKDQLDDSPFEMDKGEWEAMSRKISIHNFFSFRFAHFNIYYAAIIAITLLAALYFFAAKSDSTTIDAPKSRYDSIPHPATDTSRALPLGFKPERRKRANKISRRTNRDTATTDTRQERILPLSTTILTDSAVHTANVPAPKPKKSYSVVRQDTIPENDTVWVEKRKKRKRDN